MENKNFNKKQKYYVFLDIDGTLWDASTNFNYYGPNFGHIDFPKLSNRSIKAVNILLSSLENKFDSKLVITSERRNELKTCIDYLKHYGLKYDKPIFAIPYPTKIKRGKDIVDYMKSNGDGPIEYPNKNLFLKMLHSFKNNDYKNYVVLEDMKKLISGYIPKERLIFSNHNKRSVTIKQVEKYLKDNNIEMVLPEEKSSQQNLWTSFF